jgi:membrane protease YdiL (CAAX protease family)
VLYILTRSLWLAIGTHLAWNVWQIFLGLPVSGTPGNDGYWTARITGGTWLTGGTFGYQDAGQCSVLQVGGERQEGSVVTTLLWLTVAAVLLHVAIRRGRIRPLRPPEHALEGQEPQHRH